MSLYHFTAEIRKSLGHEASCIAWSRTCHRQFWQDGVQTASVDDELMDGCTGADGAAMCRAWNAVFMSAKALGTTED